MEIYIFILNTFDEISDVVYSTVYPRQYTVFPVFLYRSESFIMFAKNTKNLNKVYKAESDLKYYNVLYIFSYGNLW